MSDEASIVSVHASRAEELAEELYREVVTPNASQPSAPPPPPLGELSFPVDPGKDWTPAHTPRTGNTPVPGGLSFSRHDTGTSHSHRSRPASALASGGRASGAVSPGRTTSQQPGSPLPSQRPSSVMNPQLVVSGGPTPPATAPASPAPASAAGGGGGGAAAFTATDAAAATAASVVPAGPTQPAPFEAGRPHPHKVVSPPRVVAVDSGPYPYPHTYSPGSTGTAGGATSASGAAPGVPPLQLDLPSHVRGYTMQSISPHGTGNFSAGGGAGCSPSGRALGPLAIPSERNTSPPLPQATGYGSYGSGGGAGGGGGYGYGQGGTPPGAYRRGPDRVDAYLARFQLHTAIRAGFRTRSDDVQRSVEDLEARLQTMRQDPQAPGGEGAAAGPPQEGAAPQTGSRPNTAGGNATSHTSYYPRPQSPPALPDPPGGRNRFAPPPAGGAFGAARPPSASQHHGLASSHRPASASAPGSGRGSPAHADTAGGGGLAAGGAVAAGAAGQGAYLALPDGSFAGSAPFKAAPSAEGLCFERYNRHQRTTADLPELQLRYLRPPGVTAPQQPRMLAKVPRQGQPPQRTLPNGIPASRIERLSARRRSRSPPKLYQAQPLPPRQDTVMLTGAPAGTTGAGALAGLSAEDLYRSTGSLGSPKGRSAAAAAAADGGGAGALAQYLAVNTAPATGEPLLDENFYSVLQQHFKSSVLQQTQQLRAHLNVSLPVVLGAMNCVNVAEAPYEAPPPGPGAGTGSFAAATVARLQGQQAQVMTGSGRMLSGGGGGGGGGGGESGRRA